MRPLLNQVVGGIVPRMAGERREQGFVVVVVLWLMAMIAALLLIYVNYVVSTGNLVATATQRVQTDSLMRAAVELTAYQLGQSKDSDRPTHGIVETRLGATRFHVEYRSEGARVDLNLATREILAGLMQGLGASAEEAHTSADRIIAWRSPVKSGDDDTEDSYYLHAGVSYTPRHAPFPVTDELWLVQGIPPSLIERMIPFITVFSNVASINIIDAAPEVLTALPGMNPGKIQTILNMREDPSIDPRALNSQFGGDAKPPKAFRLNAEVRLDGGRLAKAEIVILLLQEADEPYRVLSWKEE